MEHYEKIEDENERLKDKLQDLEDRSPKDGVREYENKSRMMRKKF